MSSISDENCFLQMATTDEVASAVRSGRQWFRARHGVFAAWALVLTLMVVTGLVVPSATATAQTALKLRESDSIDQPQRMCTPGFISRYLGAPRRWRFDDDPPIDLHVLIADYEVRIGTSGAETRRYVLTLVTYYLPDTSTRIAYEEAALRRIIGNIPYASVSRRSAACGDVGVSMGTRHDPIYHSNMYERQTRPAGGLFGGIFGEEVVEYQYTPLMIWSRLSPDRPNPGAGPGGGSVAVVPPRPKSPDGKERPGSAPPGKVATAPPTDKPSEVGSSGPLTGPDMPADRPRLDPDGKPLPRITSPARPPVKSGTTAPPPRTTMAPPDVDPEPPEMVRTTPPKKYEPPRYFKEQELAKGSVGPLKASDLIAPTGAPVSERRAEGRAASADAKPLVRTVFAPEAVECSDEGNWLLGYMALLTPPASSGAPGKLLLRQRYALNNYVTEGRTTRGEIIRQYPRAQCQPGEIECSTPRETRTLSQTQYQQEKARAAAAASKSGEGAAAEGDKPATDRIGAGTSEGAPTALAGWRCTPSNNGSGNVECRSPEKLQWRCEIGAKPEADVCQAIEPARWWCVPRKEFCYAKARFGDWGSQLKEGSAIDIKLGENPSENPV